MQGNNERKRRKIVLRYYITGGEMNNENQSIINRFQQLKNAEDGKIVAIKL